MTKAQYLYQIIDAQGNAYALQQKGLKPMEAMGAKFDENFHEAITQIPAPSPEAKGTVVDVVKKGYFLNDEVLRFAQVVVAN